MKIPEKQLKDLLAKNRLPGLHLDEDELKAFSKAIVAIEFHEGEKVIYAGETCDWIAIVLDGQLQEKESAKKYSFGDIVGARGIHFILGWGGVRVRVRVRKG
jgi:hypothetical protein